MQRALNVRYDCRTIEHCSATAIRQQRGKMIAPDDIRMASYLLSRECRVHARYDVLHQRRRLPGRARHGRGCSRGVEEMEVGSEIRARLICQHVQRASSLASRCAVKNTKSGINENAGEKEHSWL